VLADGMATAEQAGHTIRSRAVNENDRQMLQDIWRHVAEMSKRLEKLEHKVDAVEKRLGERIDVLSQRIERLEEKLIRTDLLVDRLAQQHAEDFSRMQARMDERFERVDRRFERIEARLDAIDGRLTTLTATVTLHDLKLREAT
jgi:hypothetical protein